MSGEVIGFTSVVCIFGWPLALILTNHYRKVLELKLRLKEHADQALLDELKEMKRQLTDLRDTTTKYDMSFDAALQRVESRMSHLEQRMSRQEDRAETAPTTHF